MYIVGDWRVSEAELQNELITAFRQGKPRRMVALIRAGGDISIGIGERSVPSALFASRICQSRTKASKWPFLPFSPFVTIKEKERESQIVSFLSGIFPVSVMIVISSLDFFL